MNSAELRYSQLRQLGIVEALADTADTNSEYLHYLRESQNLRAVLKPTQPEEQTINQVKRGRMADWNCESEKWGI